MLKEMWIDKYRPPTVDTYIFSNDHQKELVTKYIKDKSFPHLLLTGLRGTGKTTLAMILQHACGVDDCDFMFMNASDENSVEDIRGVVKSFVRTVPLGEFKIVLLDEADYLSPAAQGALRGMMEQYASTARFILTCNYEQKITPELHSRCTRIEFNAMDMTEFLRQGLTVLTAEHVKITSTEQLATIKDLASAVYPDLRQFILTLEAQCDNGVLSLDKPEDSQGLGYVRIVDTIINGNCMSIRDCINTIAANDWHAIYRFLYDNLHDIDGFDVDIVWKQGIIVISEHLRYHETVAFPDITFMHCIIRLSELINKGNTNG